MILNWFQGYTRIENRKITWGEIPDKLNQLPCQANIKITWGEIPEQDNKPIHLNPTNSIEFVTMNFTGDASFNGKYEVFKKGNEKKHRISLREPPTRAILEYSFQFKNL